LRGLKEKMLANELGSNACLPSPINGVIIYQQWNIPLPSVIIF
jgi:hypothetical protein